VLPDIQREYVWEFSEIERLFGLHGRG